MLERQTSCELSYLEVKTQAFHTRVGKRHVRDCVCFDQARVDVMSLVLICLCTKMSLSQLKSCGMGPE